MRVLHGFAAGVVAKVSYSVISATFLVLRVGIHLYLKPRKKPIANINTHISLRNTRERCPPFASFSPFSPRACAVRAPPRYLSCLTICSCKRALSHPSCLFATSPLQIAIMFFLPVTPFSTLPAIRPRFLFGGGSCLFPSSMFYKAMEIGGKRLRYREKTAKDKCFSQHIRRIHKYL